MNEPRFDWLPILKAEFIDELSNEIVKHINVQPKKGMSINKKKDSLHQIATHIISGLFQATVMSNKSKAISIPMSNDYYNSKDVTGSKVQYSKDYTREVINALIDLNWIDSVTGSEATKKFTRISAKGFLLNKFKDIGFIWFEQKVLPERKTALLRDVNRDENNKPIRDKKSNKTTKFYMQTPESQDVSRMRSNLKEINSFLVKQCISMDIDDDQLKAMLEELSSGTDKENINLYNVQLVRIFSRGSMEKGGRFYRGWWQAIPSKYRPLIRLNSKRTIEVDYSSIGLRILYARVDMALPVEKDLYDIGLDNWIPFKDERRPIVKKVFNALINDEDKVYKLEKKYKKVLGLTLDEFLDRVREHHKPIFHLLRSDAGLESQKVDSDVAEQVMLELIYEGIPVLPIHDSFIVPVGYMIEPLLNGVFKRIVKQGIACEAEYVMGREQFGKTKEEVLQEAEREIVVKGAELKDGLLNRKYSSIDYYVASYHKQLSSKSLVRNT
jgi:hypothetical protein